MKRYMLLPEDTIELLPQDGEAECAVAVFCERTLILFPCSKIESVLLLRNVREDRRKPEDCLCIRAREDVSKRQVLLSRCVPKRRWGAAVLLEIPCVRVDVPAAHRGTDCPLCGRGGADRVARV